MGVFAVARGGMPVLKIRPIRRFSLVATIKRWMVSPFDGSDTMTGADIPKLPLVLPPPSPLPSLPSSPPLPSPPPSQPSSSDHSPLNQSVHHGMHFRALCHGQTSTKASHQPAAACHMAMALSHMPRVATTCPGYMTAMHVHLPQPMHTNERRQPASAAYKVISFQANILSFERYNRERLKIGFRLENAVFQTAFLCPYQIKHKP